MATISLKARVLAIMERGIGDDTSRAARAFENGITVLILLNVAAVVLETVKGIGDVSAGQFRLFEVLSVSLFTAEYLLRLWSCTADPRYAHPLFGRLRFASRPMVVADLAAIAPFYVSLCIPSAHHIAGVFRVLRLVRLVKLGRYSRAGEAMLRVLRDRRRELGMALGMVLLLLVIAASLLYCAEGKEQPEAFGSIPHALWWAVTTLSTVGYGDVVPVTVAGKILAGVIALLAVGAFALPAGILAAGMTEEMQSRFGLIRLCPHCGMDLDRKPHAPALEPKTADALRREREAARTYVPKPIDTEQVRLPQHLVELGERLAENVHDQWAAMRMSQGWAYGPTRNDRLRVHPDLVPYADLTEEDREYDRKSAMGTLAAILALGYTITPPRRDAGGTAGTQEP